MVIGLRGAPNGEAEARGVVLVGGSVPRFCRSPVRSGGDRLGVPGCGFGTWAVGEWTGEQSQRESVMPEHRQ